jgi:tRNA threonylcarbamoyladenosine biosynthesis protein TsaE
MTEKSQVLHSESETEDLAANLSFNIKALFLKQDLLSLRIALIGDLGAGKTTFTRYLLKSLGHTGKVKSPTYALCEPYEIALSLTSEPHQFSQKKLHIHHFDLYRMNQANEWIDAGFKETLTNPGICIVEWPEKAEGTLPPFDLTIHLETNDDQTRFVKLIGHTKIGQNLVS